MAYCSKCGTQLSEGANFCPKCGTPCTNASKSVDSNAGGQKKPSKTSYKALLGVILIIAIIGGGWYLWNNQSENYSLEGLAKAVVNYDDIWNFYDGMAMVEKGGKYGYIDKLGNEVIPCIYNLVEINGSSSSFSDGLALVGKGEDLFYINKKGEKAFPFNYDISFGFSEGYAVVGKDDKYGFIDKTGKEVVPCIYDYAVNFSDGMAAVMKGNYYGYINSSLNLAIPISIEDAGEVYSAHSFSEGYAVITRNGKAGFIDKTGKEVVPCIYDMTMDFSEGKAAVMKGHVYGFIDTNGNEVIPCEYDYADSFHEGLAVVTRGKKWLIIDKNGKQVFEYEYEDDPALIGKFKDGLIRIMKPNTSLSGFVDRSGNEVIPFIYETWSDFSEGLVAVSKDGINGYVDKNGKSTFDIKNGE